MRIWVVGGTSGIGAACAEKLKSLDHKVFATGVTHGDVRWYQSLEGRHISISPVNAIVYSAGINVLDWWQDLDPEDMMKVYNVNVVGLLRVLHTAPEAEKVVVIGSDAAWRPMRTSIAYNASKAALHEMVRCIARERASARFQINVVAPGLIEDTEMSDYVYNRTKEIRPDLSLAKYSLRQIPMYRAGRSAEVAEVVANLLTMPNYLNGAIIPVNGAR